MALSKDEMIEIATGFLESIRRKHDVREAYLFGSYVTGAAKDYSDIDLAVVLGSIKEGSEPHLDEAFQIFHEAQEYNSLLEVVCFDLRDFDLNGGSLVKKIKKDGIKLL